MFCLTKWRDYCTVRSPYRVTCTSDPTQIGQARVLVYIFLIILDADHDEWNMKYRNLIYIMNLKCVFGVSILLGWHVPVSCSHWKYLGLRLKTEYFWKWGRFLVDAHDTKLVLIDMEHVVQVRKKNSVLRDSSLYRLLLIKTRRPFRWIIWLNDPPWINIF